MQEVDRAMFYIFVLSLILVSVAYYVGSTSVLNSLGTNIGSLILTSTGRNSSGTFSAYPAGG
jgi:hypothetical protein